MKNYDQYNNPSWPYIPDHSYRNLIAGGSGSGKTNVCVIELNKTSMTRC